MNLYFVILIIYKLVNKLDFIHNIKCINSNKLLKFLSNNILNIINITNNNYMKKFNICKKCKFKIIDNVKK
jgi:hypothetical protein